MQKIPTRLIIAVVGVVLVAGVVAAFTLANKLPRTAETQADNTGNPNQGSTTATAETDATAADQSKDAAQDTPKTGTTDPSTTTNFTQHTTNTPSTTTHSQPSSSAAPSTPTPTPTPTNTQSPATNITFSNVGMRAVTVNFNPGFDSDGIDHYEVRNNGRTLTTTGTSVTDDWVFPGNTYTYTVYIVDKLGNTNQGSTSASVTTTADHEPPSVPTNFHMYDQDGTKAYFTWTDSVDNSATPNIDLEYETLISPAPNFDWTSGTHATVYTDPGVTYTIRIRAVDYAGNYSAYTDPITFTDL